MSLSGPPPSGHHGGVRILITGGTGFLGRALARRLRERGEQVRLFARGGARGSALGAEGFEVVAGDVRDPAAVDAAVAGMEGIVHLAATYRPEGVPIAEFRSVNADGTRNVMAASARHGVARVVHASTTGVYGRVFDPPVDEDHACRPPWDHYQRTKWEGEQIARQAFATALAGRGVVVRPTGVYGPDDTRFLKVLRPLSRRRFVYPGRGNVLYHPSYIDDVVTGLELALFHEKAPGGIYHLAGPRYFTLREYIGVLAGVLGVPEPRLHVPMAPLFAAATLCELACRALRVEPFLYRRRLAFFRDHRAFSSERARRDLGYQPAMDLAEGMRRMVEWSRAQGLL